MVLFFQHLYAVFLAQRQPGMQPVRLFADLGTIPGSLGDIRRMHGELDEVSVYNRALTPQEIAAIFAAGRAAKCKPS